MTDKGSATFIMDTEDLATKMKDILKVTAYKSVEKDCIIYLEKATG